jgi:hypothetical protein
MSRIVEDLEGQLHSIRTRYQAIELAERDTKDEYYQKCQDIAKFTKENE